MALLCRRLHRILPLIATSNTGSTFTGNGVTARAVSSTSSHFVSVKKHQPNNYFLGDRLYSSNVKAASKEEIEKLVKNKKLVVFMKGEPAEPRCGFSNAVVQVLRMHGVTSYDSYNVLENESIRQGIKDYSNWPTIPQIYINGEFVGGCDIFLEMHKSGELVQQLEKVGIKSQLGEPEENDEQKK